MYIKVHVKNYQLFREDNGDLIGEAALPLLVPTCSTYKCNDKRLTLSYGYMDTTGSFVKLCRATNCSFACLNEKKPECRYCCKGSSQGFYVDL